MKNKNVWFESKRYGHTPVSWQGWLVSLIYLGTLIYWFNYIDVSSHSGSDTLISFTPIFAALSIGYIFICRNRSNS